MTVRLLVEALEFIEHCADVGRCSCCHTRAARALAAFRSSPALADDPAAVEAVARAVFVAHFGERAWGDEGDHADETRQSYEASVRAALRAVDLYQRTSGGPPNTGGSER